MTKIKRTVSLIALAVLSALAFVFSAVLIAMPESEVFANPLFEESNYFTVEYDKSAPNDDSGLKGVKLTSNIDNRTIGFKGELGGVFEVAFRPIASVDGVFDFTKVTFSIRSNDSRFGLQLYLQQTSETKVKYGVTVNMPEVSYGRGTSKDATKTDFKNTGDIARIGFDNRSMEVYYYNGATRYVMTDLDDQYNMAQMSTTALFKGFSTYNVEMTLSGLTGNTASVILYSLNGQSLAGETFVNDVGAEICGEPSVHNGVKGKEYVIPADVVGTYDVIDGVKDTFSGTITATAPSGIQTELTDNKFTPGEVGGYTLTFAAKDSEGLFGRAKSVKIKVFETEPETQILTAFPFENATVGTGATVVFPAAESSSDLDYNNEKAIVKLSVATGNEQVAQFNANTSVEYKFTAAGEYTVTMSATNPYGTVTEVVRAVTVTDDAPVFILEKEFAEIYAADQILSVPRATVSTSGGFANSTVYYPDGRVVSTDNISLDVIGVYKVVYDFGGYTLNRYFTVDKESVSLWDNIRGVSAAFSIAPSYCAELYEGVVLTATRSNATARYANLIDLSDNGSRDKLLEFIPVPQENLELEFSEMRVTLVDAYDQNNKVTIRFNKDTYADHYVIYVSVCANKEGIFTKETSVRGSFHGAYNSKNFGQYPAIPTTIYFDYLTLTVYGSIKNNSGDFYKVIADLTDEEQVGKGNAFGGFTTGLVYMDISFSGVVASGANLMILNVDGQDFGSRYVQDGTAPLIVVDYDGNEEDDLPSGVVNGKYPIFKSSAFDLVDGLCATPKVKVYYYTDSINRVRYSDVNGEYFVPDKTGLYCMEYTAQDRHGNTSKQLVFVEMVETLPELEYDFGSFEEQAETGEKIVIPTGGESGGSGNVSVEFTCVFNGTENVTLDNFSFIPVKSGTYVITARLKDYLGNEREFTHTVTVSSAFLPKFEEKVVPVVAMKGRQVNLAKWLAYDYSSGVRTAIDVSVSVDGVDLSDWKWTPDKAGACTLTFKATNVNGSAIVTREVEVLDSAAEGVYLSNFFAKENVSFGGTASTFIITATAENAGVTFANPLYASGFRLRFSIPVETNAFKAVRITLADSQNVSQKLVFDIEKNENENADWSKFVFGSEVKEITGSFFGVTAIPFEINYDVDKAIITDYSGNTVYIVEHAYDGSAWKGFESGMVYVSMEFVDIEGEAAFNLMGISNQTFAGRTKKDTIIPQIISQTVSSVEYGEKIVIAPAYAYDILSEVTKFTLTVYSPSGTKLLDAVDPIVGYEILADAYGSYRIEYYVEDSAGNNNKYIPASTIVNIYDKELPVITVNGTVPTLVAVGKSISIPSATVTDNATDDISLLIWVVEPSGRLVSVTGSYTPTVQGKHVLVYYACDSSGCTAIQTYEITVGRAE